MYFLILNIPEDFHSIHLRRYFYHMIENESFICFHFRHRPTVNLIEVAEKELLQVEKEVAEITAIKTLDDISETILKLTDLLKTKHNCDQPQTVKIKSLIDNLQKFITNDILLSSLSGFSSQMSILRANLEQLADAILQSNENLYRMNPEINFPKTNLEKLSDLIKITKKNAMHQNSIQSTDSLQTAIEKLSILNTTLESISSCNINPFISNNSLERNLDKFYSLINNTRDSFKKYMKYPNLEDNFNSSTSCLVNVKDKFAECFMKLYNNKCWMHTKGTVLNQQCLLLQLENVEQKTQVGSNYINKKEQKKNALKFSFANLESCEEMKPPPLMPNGNCGTPTDHFKTLINECKLPTSLINRLGLKFNHRRNTKRYSFIPYNYGTKISPSPISKMPDDVAVTADGHYIPRHYGEPYHYTHMPKKRKLRKKKQSSKRSKGPIVTMENAEIDEDGDDVEENERFESFHNDVTTQERTKEKRFESEMEVTWEKGGSGLVFYTDAQVWRAQEDLDDHTPDEWDVDMSAYYKEGAGDMDARDSLSMQGADQDKSCFTVKHPTAENSRRIIGCALPPIGSFEAHTKGFGRFMMEKMGWKDGRGLGRDGWEGMPFALENEGQNPRNKKGFGYRGVKRFYMKKSRKAADEKQTPSPNEGEVRISTIYDKPHEENSSALPITSQGGIDHPVRDQRCSYQPITEEGSIKLPIRSQELTTLKHMDVTFGQRFVKSFN